MLLPSRDDPWSLDVGIPAKDPRIASEGRHEGRHKRSLDTVEVFEAAYGFKRRSCRNVCVRVLLAV